jgi:hypothetical protein
MKVILFLTNLQNLPELIKQISEKRDFHNELYTLFFVEKFGLKGFMKNYKKKIGSML